MTEYDFSPEAYQRHMANMHRITKWVDHTEHHRSEFADAAALATPNSMESSHRREGFQRRPPPLHLPPSGHPYPYPHSVSSSSSSSEVFAYGGGPHSPGPMPGSMYRSSPAPAYGPRASPPHIASPYNPSPRSPAFSHGQRSPTYFMPPPTPYAPYSAMTPGYVIVPQRGSRKGRSSRHKSSRSGSYVVSFPFKLPSLLLIMAFRLFLALHVGAVHNNVLLVMVSSTCSCARPEGSIHCPPRFRTGGTWTPR
jgi:hypothetical protein